jgi:hypothetical protein
MEKRVAINVNLESSIQELPLSDGLIRLLKERGFVKLGDVMKENIPVLRQRIGMSFEQEMELFKLVEQSGLEQYWKE